jgi:hypothetical protein
MLGEPKKALSLDTILVFIGVQYDPWSSALLRDLSFTNICPYSLCNDERIKMVVTF